MQNQPGTGGQLKTLDEMAGRHPLKAARLLYTPPGWVLRAPVYLIFVVLFAALLYSVWAKKDELVSAPLVLEREATVVEAVGGGMVRGVGVRENDLVRPGDLLVSVQEQTRIAMSPEQERMIKQIDELEDELRRTRDDYDHQLDQKRRDLEDFDVNRESKARSLEATVKQLEESLNATRRSLQRAQERLARVTKLYRAGDATVSSYEQAQQAVDSSRAQASQTEIELNESKLKLQDLSDLHGKEKLEKEIERLEQRREEDLIKLAERREGLKRRLEAGENLVEGVSFNSGITDYKSIFSGVVTKVAAKRGEIISAGTPLVTVVKDSAPLEARISISNKDIGRIRVGQEVKIKYHAYPYQEYGIQTGVISYIAKRPNTSETGVASYPVTVALHKETIARHGGREKPLEIGLQGIAEIKTGDKRFIEILIRPLSKFFSAEE